MKLTKSVLMRLIKEEMEEMGGEMEDPSHERAESPHKEAIEHLEAALAALKGTGGSEEEMEEMPPEPVMENKRKRKPTPKAKK